MFRGFDREIISFQDAVFNFASNCYQTIVFVHIFNLRKWTMTFGQLASAAIIINYKKIGGTSRNR